MRRLIRIVVLVVASARVLGAQARPDTTTKRTTPDSVKAATQDSAAPRSGAALPKVTVRAQRRRVPSVRSGGIDDGSSRDEPQSFQLLDALTQGGITSLFGASPDFVATAGGGFSLLGGPPESSQLTIGGVRVPSGFVTGAVRATITSSPWDVTNGGAAGATVNLAVRRGSDFGSTYMVLRSSASGVLAGGEGAPPGLNLPVQVTINSDGRLRALRYSLSAFASHDAVSLRRWDTGLTASTRAVLDSLARITGTPLVRAAEAQRQYGVITRIDLPHAAAPGPLKTSDAFTLSLSRTSGDAGTRGGFNAASSGFTTRLDVGALQFESARLVRGFARIISSIAVSASESAIDQRTSAPIIQLTDSGLGALINAGGSMPAPTARNMNAEARSQASWFSANNRKRYLIQLQSRYEQMTVRRTSPQSTFLVSSAADLQTGRAVALSRTSGSGGASAHTAVLAPAGSIGFDMGRRGSMLLGARIDGWLATDVVMGTTLRRVDLSPRLSFQQQVGQRSKGRGAFGTLRGGVGRFTDWPSLQQWSGAWSNAGELSVSCTGSSVPTLDLASPDSECVGSSAAVTTGRLLAAPSLQPVSSTRGELSLQVHQLVRGIRAEFGVSASTFDRVMTLRSPYFGRTIAGRLSGESGRALIVDPASIPSTGIVPLASLPSGDAASPTLAPDGRSTGYQYRVRLATRDPWSRTQLEANYAWNGGTQRGALITPAYSTPGLLSAPAAGNRHTIMASIGAWLGVSQLYATVIARSGVRFTPRADRDLNGDGVANDAAFIPVEQANAWASESPAYVRECIRRAAGSVVMPNACAGPWSISSMLKAQIPGPKVGLPRGVELTLQVSNPTALFGSLSGGTLSFGGSPFVDPTLVRVAAFDAATQQFRTERLKGFGRPVGLTRSVTDPVRLAISVRVPLGRGDFEKRIEETVRLLASDTVTGHRASASDNLFPLLPNIPELFLQQVNRIELTREQRVRLSGLATAWKAIAPRAISKVSARRADDADARRALLLARSVALVEFEAIVARIRTLLSPGQLALLEPSEAMMLNPRVFRFVELSANPL